MFLAEWEIAMIPVVDCKGDIRAAGSDIFRAVSTVGFVYLKDFGIPSEKVRLQWQVASLTVCKCVGSLHESISDKLQVQKTFEVADKFWALDEGVKAHYSRGHEYETEGNTG